MKIPKWLSETFGERTGAEPREVAEKIAWTRPAFEQIPVEMKLDRLAEIIRPIMSESIHDSDRTYAVNVATAWFKLSAAMRYACDKASMIHEHKKIGSWFYQVYKSTDDIGSRIAIAPTESGSVAIPVDHLVFLSDHGQRCINAAHDYLWNLELGPGDLPPRVLLHPKTERFARMHPDINDAANHIKVLDKAAGLFQKPLIDDAELDALSRLSVPHP